MVLVPEALAESWSDLGLAHSLCSLHTPITGATLLFWKNSDPAPSLPLPGMCIPRVAQGCLRLNFQKDLL